MNQITFQTDHTGSVILAVWQFYMSDLCYREGKMKGREDGERRRRKRRGVVREER